MDKLKTTTGKKIHEWRRNSHPRFNITLLTVHIKFYGVNTKKKKSLAWTTVEQNNFLRDITIPQIEVNFILFNYTLLPI